MKNWKQKRSALLTVCKPYQRRAQAPRRVDGDFCAVCRVAEMGGRSARALDRSHLRLRVAGCEHLPGTGITRETLRKNNIAGSIEQAGEPPGGPREHQSPGVLSGNRKSSAH